MKDRIYVCHTFYHVYITFLKEFNMPKEKQGHATLVLSLMTQDFKEAYSRIKESGVFEEVILFDEKKDSFFPELAPYMNMQGNQLKIMLGRMKYTKLYGKLEETYIPVDFSAYKDIYVYCDSDPIGFYLNYKKIKYHAIEDGLNTLKEFPSAWNRNHKFYKLKVFLSSLNLLFIEDGFGKYCIDMEVNELEGIKYRNHKYFEVSRRALKEGITSEDKKILLKVFIADVESLEALVFSEKTSLLLTEPLCDLETRKQIFSDLVSHYKKEGGLVIKPHPNDSLDYVTLFSDIFIIERKMPMEVLEFIEGLQFEKIISVFTEITDIDYAKQRVRLGADFMDKYEDASVHRCK